MKEELVSWEDQGEENGKGDEKIVKKVHFRPASSISMAIWHDLFSLESSFRLS